MSSRALLIGAVVVLNAMLLVGSVRAGVREFSDRQSDGSSTRRRTWAGIKAAVRWLTFWAP